MNYILPVTLNVANALSGVSGAYGSWYELTSGLPFKTSLLSPIIQNQGYGAINIGVGTSQTIVAPDLPFNNTGNFNPCPIEIPAFAPIYIQYSSGDSTQLTSNISVIVLPETEDNKAIGTMMTSQYITSIGPGTAWTQIGSSPTPSVPVRGFLANIATNNGAGTNFSWSLGYGPSSSNVITIFDNVVFTNPASYININNFYRVKIPPSMNLYGVASLAGGVFNIGLNLVY